METIEEIFSFNVSRFREKLALTQEELAHKLGVTRTTIQNYERKRSWPKSPKALIDLAEALRITPLDLMKQHISPTQAKLEELRNRIEALTIERVDLAIEFNLVDVDDSDGSDVWHRNNMRIDSIDKEIEQIGYQIDDLEDKFPHLSNAQPAPPTIAGMAAEITRLDEALKRTSNLAGQLTKYTAFIEALGYDPRNLPDPKEVQKLGSNSENPDFIPQDIFDRFRKLDPKHHDSVRAAMGLPRASASKRKTK